MSEHRSVAAGQTATVPRSGNGLLSGDEDRVRYCRPRMEAGKKDKGSRQALQAARSLVVGHGNSLPSRLARCVGPQVVAGPVNLLSKPPPPPPKRELRIGQRQRETAAPAKDRSRRPPVPGPLLSSSEKTNQPTPTFSPLCFRNPHLFSSLFFPVTLAIHPGPTRPSPVAVSASPSSDRFCRQLRHAPCRIHKPDNGVQGECLVPSADDGRLFAPPSARPRPPPAAGRRPALALALARRLTTSAPRPVSQRI